MRLKVQSLFDLCVAGALNLSSLTQGNVNISFPYLLPYEKMYEFKSFYLSINKVNEYSDHIIKSIAVTKKIIRDDICYSCY